MNWWAVLLAVVSGVAAALVNDPRPKAKAAAKKKAPPDSATSVPKKEPGPAPSPAEAPKPAETPLDIEVPREGVASALPLIVVGQPANLSSGPERRPGESRRKRRSRPEDKATQTQAAGPAVHRCPACGHALAPELAPIAVESVNAAAPAEPVRETPTAPAAATAPEPASSEEHEEADDDYFTQLDLSGSLATPECGCPEAPATPEPAATPRRGSRVGAKGERLTLRLATRRALGKLG